MSALRAILKSWRRGADAADPQTAAQRRAERARRRARRRAFWRRVYSEIDSLFHINPADFFAFLRMFVKWAALGALVGALAGSASALFLVTLAWATDFRLDHPQLLFLLPFAGLIVGWLYHRFAGAAALGNNLVIDAANASGAQIPFRMTPLVLFGTIVTHLFGGSVGREGTAVQMGASLADSLQRALKLSAEDRRLIIMAGISGGFGSVFGTPTAGFVFGMEVQSVGRMRYDGIIPCLAAAYVGDLVARFWGAAHAHHPPLAAVQIEPLLLIKVLIAGVLFGLTSILFIELTHGIKKLHSAFLPYPPLRSFVGGAAIIGLTLLLGTQDYLGLSEPLIERSLSGAGTAPAAFLLKLVFTAVTLGSGFVGGEVTPLFVTGSTLGYTLGALLGVDPTFLASIGFAAVFAGASNTPLACTLMSIELFGGGSLLYVILGCTAAYLASGHRGIYATQRVGSPKFIGADILTDESLQALLERRGGGWLPALPNVSGALAQRSVRSLMSPRPVAVREEAALHEMVELAVREGLRSLPVVSADNRVIGIVTDNDLKRAGIAYNLSRLMHLSPEERAAALETARGQTVRSVMTASPLTIEQTATLGQAVEVLEANQLKRLPVVDAAGHLMGIITRSDILREIAASTERSSADGIFNWRVTVDAVELEAASVVGASAPLAQVIRAMREQGRKRVIVVDDAGRAVGIVTENDLLERAAAGDRARILRALVGQAGGAEDEAFPQTAGDVMTAPIITVTPDDAAVTALNLLIENGIKRLPVVDEARRPLGMVGRAGLIRAMTGSEAV
jgi:H+/Cl- antiporter ClcA/CBS-domain-containing membrane protein